MEKNQPICEKCHGSGFIRIYKDCLCLDKRGTNHPHTDVPCSCQEPIGGMKTRKFQGTPEEYEKARESMNAWKRGEQPTPEKDEAHGKCCDNGSFDDGHECLKQPAPTPGEVDSKYWEADFALEFALEVEPGIYEGIKSFIHILLRSRESKAREEGRKEGAVEQWERDLSALSEACGTKDEGWGCWHVQAIKIISQTNPKKL